MRNQQQAILGSRSLGLKRLKRKRELQKRLKCHGNKDNHLFHIKKPELRVIIKKQSWTQKIKEFFLKIIKRK